MLHILSKTQPEGASMTGDVSYVVTYPTEIGPEITIYTKRGLAPALGVSLSLEAQVALLPLLAAHVAEQSGSTLDWWVDGHFIIASSAEQARAEAGRRFDFEPQVVRPWTAEDQRDLDEQVS